MDNTSEVRVKLETMSKPALCRFVSAVATIFLIFVTVGVKYGPSPDGTKTVEAPPVNMAAIQANATDPGNGCMDHLDPTSTRIDLADMREDNRHLDLRVKHIRSSVQCAQEGTGTVCASDLEAFQGSIQTQLRVCGKDDGGWHMLMDIPKEVMIECAVGHTDCAAFPLFEFPNVIYREYHIDLCIACKKGENQRKRMHGLPNMTRIEISASWGTLEGTVYLASFKCVVLRLLLV